MLHMLDSPRSLPMILERDARPKEDLTGRDRLVSNVLFSWAAHSVFIVSGFIMPRMIDRRLGQDLLGVWDFAWSLVSYFQLVRAAIGSSVNRYVAKYWAAGDASSLNRLVSSATLMLGLGGLLVMGLSVIAFMMLPQWFGHRLGENAREAQWVVLFLGASLGVQISFSAFNGVLTGCHQWGLHNINTSGWYAATVTAMIVALLLGCQLRALALINLVGEVLSSLRRIVLAYRVCPGLQVRPSLICWSTIKDLFYFGGKTLIPSISNLLLNQTSSVLILAYINPAALALYSRPRALIHHAAVLVNKMAMVLSPTASSLHSVGDMKEVRELVVKSTWYTLYLSLPLVLMLVVFGGPIVQVWMGPGYRPGLVCAVLAIGYLPYMVQLPTLNILAGLNAHGRPGVARLITSIVSVGLNILVLGFLKWGLVGTALAVTVPLSILNLVDIPRVMSRRVGLTVRQYYLSAWVEPVVCMLPFTACLVSARLVFHARPLLGLVVATLVGSVVLAVIYWRRVLPQRVRRKVLDVIQSGRRSAWGLISGR